MEKQHELNERLKEEEIDRLTAFWYDYVGGDHHKDNDCHWYVEKDWAYGKVPQWRAYHYGYIFEGYTIDASSYDDALSKLIGLLQAAIYTEKIWANNVMDDKSKWDKVQVAKAETAIAFNCDDFWSQYIEKGGR